MRENIIKIAVIGANGQLGHDICQAFQSNGNEVLQLNHSILDITDIDTLNNILKQAKVKLIINTAAMHNVEECENNPLKAFEVNGLGARNLAILSNEYDFTLVHISTDYVFNGTKKAPYIETDYPKPLNVYGNTKLSGELFIKAIAEKYYIVRVSGLYGTNPCRAKSGDNFIKLMLRLAKERDEVRVVDDEIVTPTFTEDIAKQIVLLSSTGPYGLYHVTEQGSCSWYEFAAKIFELTKIDVKLSIAHPDEFPAKVPRPKYSVLENRNLQEIGIDIMPDWEDALIRYLRAINTVD